jgi:hypothetical protein
MVMFTGALLLNGCAGSGTTNNSGKPVETILKIPAGNYTITVVAISGAVSHSTNVTLGVQ